MNMIISHVRMYYGSGTVDRMLTSGGCCYTCSRLVNAAGGG